MGDFLKLVGLGAVMGSLAICPVQAQVLPPPVSPDDFSEHTIEQVLLGRDLFFDPILSGNQNISCATCHHPSLAASDRVSLSLGEGAEGLGENRRLVEGTPIAQRIPRNAPALFNLGAHEFTTLFHDGRVQANPDAPFGIAMPDGFHTERAPDSPLAAQALLPMTSAEEMAGGPGENPVADAVHAGRIQGPDGARGLIAARVAAVPDYARRFNWLRGTPAPLHISEIGNALAAFMAFEFRATNSAFDALLRGEYSGMSNEALLGMALFYDKAQCSTCHAGAFQTDHSFHSLGIPPLGPGKGHGASSYADHGRAAVTQREEDAYRFRTPSLRNVTLTAPYGHNGAYAALEDTDAANGRLGAPLSVPSGLPLDALTD